MPELAVIRAQHRGRDAHPTVAAAATVVSGVDRAAGTEPPPSPLPGARGRIEAAVEVDRLRSSGENTGAPGVPSGGVTAPSRSRFTRCPVRRWRMAVHHSPSQPRLSQAGTTRQREALHEDREVILGRVLSLFLPPVVAAGALVFGGALVLARLLE